MRCTNLTRLARSFSAHAWLQGRPPSVDPSAGTLASLYYRTIRDAPQPTRDALVAPDQDVKLTLGQYDKQVYAYAVGMLEGLSLKKGMSVGTWMTGELEHAVVQWALGLLGVRAVVIDPAVGFEGVRSVVAAEQLHALILSPRVGGVDRFGALPHEFLPELRPTMAEYGYHALEGKRFRSLRHIVCTSYEQQSSGVVRFRDLVKYGLNGADYSSDDVAAVQSYVNKSEVTTQYYTAGPVVKGSAAHPAYEEEGAEEWAKSVSSRAEPSAVKGASATHETLLASAAASAKVLKLGAADTLLSTAPLHTQAGFAAGVLAPALAGAKLVLPCKVFNAEEALAAASLQRATHVLVASPAEAAALEAALAKHGKKYSLDSVRGGAVVAGGGASLRGVALPALT